MDRREKTPSLVVLLAVLLLLGGAWWGIEHPPPVGRPIRPRPPTHLPDHTATTKDHPEEVTTDMGVLGMTKPGSDWRIIYDADSRATAFPSGAPAKSYQFSTFTEPMGSWDDPISPAEEGPPYFCYSTHALLDENDIPTAIWAYLELTAVTGLGKIAAAIYTEAGSLVDGSAAQVFTETQTGWVEFPLSGSTPLQSGVSYAIWVRADYDAINDLVRIAYGPIDSYVPPAVIACSDDIILGDEAAVDDVGIGISAQDIIVFGEVMRHGGVQAPCAGRYIPPEPDEHQANPHRWDGKDDA